MDFDQYTVVRDLGRGSFGAVRLLRDNETGREVAVKVISASLDFDTEGFMRELQCQALVHPCLLGLVGFSLPTVGLDSSAKIAMEFMPGGNLQEVMASVAEKHPPAFWTPTGIAKLCVGIALGLQFLHAKGIVHRDLKPGNILLDLTGHPRVGDFGSAKSTESVTPTPNVCTPAYRAPEMLDNQAPHTTKVDSYAYGLILFEILMGGPVFAPTLAVHQIAYKSSTNTRPAIPPGAMHPSLKDLIERCWQPLPDPRPEFSEILEIFDRNNYPFDPKVDVLAVKQYTAQVRRSPHS
jgi:serine/threonine protein kinase